MSEHRPRILWLAPRDLAVFLAYVVVEWIAVCRYEPWEDEGRAWLIARSVGIYDLLFHMLRYEGHPALWYLILWPPSHLHVPYVCINWISATCGCAAAYLILRFSPFPFLVRALLPFGFALAYEFSVVGRSYALFPLLGFAACHFYRSLPVRPVALAVALALLANVSIHGTIVAVGLAAAYAWNRYRERQNTGWFPGSKREAWTGIIVFTLSICFVAICVWPPKGLVLPFTPTIVKHFFHQASVPSKTPGRSESQRPAVHPRPNLRRAAWVAMDADAPGSAQPALPRGDDSSEGRLAARVEFILGYPVAPYFPLALLFEGVTIFYLYRRGMLELAIPLLGLFGFLFAVYAKLWHVELVWVMLIMVLWIAWDRTESFRLKSVQGVAAALLALVCSLQIPWTFGAVRYEMTHLTYPAEELAKWLKTLPPGETIDGNNLTFTVYPFFEGPVFADHHINRFDKHSQYPELESIQDMIRYRTDVILVRNIELSEVDATSLNAAGYRQTHEFCGEKYFPERKIIPICFLAFTRDESRNR